MKNFLLIFLFTPLCISAVFSQSTIQKSVLFNTNEAVLNNESKKTLTELVATINTVSVYTIYLKGATDADGSDKFNQDLSKKRVQVVRSFMENKGISSSRFSTETVGESQPIADNTTTEGKQKNRRVDILISFSPPSETNNEKPKNMTQLYQQLAVKTQIFKINTNRDTILRGEKGTRLFIPKGAFVGISDNSVVDFQLKECYDFSDMIGENLTTMDGDKMLRTGGMIYTEATANGKKLEIKNSIGVEFASKESKEPNMQLFTGIRNVNRNGAMNWTPLNTSIDAQISIPKSNIPSDDVLKSKIYSRDGAQFMPYLVMTDAKKPLTLQEICNISECSTLDINMEKPSFRGVDLFTQTNSAYKVNVKSDSKNKLSSQCGALLLYLQDRPEKSKLPIERIHFEAFYDAYYLYGVKTLEDLRKQNPYSWDSLMVIRKNLMKSYETSLIQAMKQDSINAVRRAESIKKEQERIIFESKFSLPQLGWYNLDKYLSSSLVNVETDVVGSSNSDVKFILKNRKSLVGSSLTQDNKNIVGTVPINEPCVLIGLKIENGQTYLAVLELNGANLKVSLNFEALSPQEIKKKLKILN
jgi:OmpA family